MCPTQTPPRAFRAHTTQDAALLGPAARGPHDIFGQLSRDWSRVCALPSLTRTMQQWASREPALYGVASPGDLLDLIDASPPERQDALLLALIRLTHAGQQLAGRAVLQAMLPKLHAMSHRIAGGGGGELWEQSDRNQMAVAHFWEVLHAYPTTRRTRRVAGNLALDTLHAMTEARRRTREVPSATLVEELAGLPDSTLGLLAGVHRPHDDDWSRPVDLLEVIAWGVDQQAISSQDAALLVQVYAPADPERPRTQGAIAADLGLTHTALRKRCSRARQNLIAAVQDDIAGARSQPSADSPWASALLRRQLADA